MGKEAPVDIEATSHTQPPALATRKVADEEAASSQLPPESSGVEDSMQLRKEKSAVDRKVSNSATAFHAAASRLIQGYLAPLLATPAFRVFVILAFAVMVSLGIVAITEMKEGLPLSILTR